MEDDTKGTEGAAIEEQKKEMKKVGTHSGRFHADEVMATAILQELYELEVVRSRDTEALEGLDIIYDVGGGEFDHHQVEKEYRESGIPYAACGLIWRRFGREVARSMEPSLSDEQVESVFNSVDQVLMEGIDASDNGMRTYETIVPIYSVSLIIAEMNPPWNAEFAGDQAFFGAVRFASRVLRNTLKHKIAMLMARTHVEAAYNNRQRPEVLVLDRAYPWGQILRDIDEKKEVLYAVYPRDGQFLLQTVRRHDGIRGDRKPLPKSWAGKRDEELGRIVGIGDAIFCHPSRFIAGAGSMESIMIMADLAVKEPVIVVKRNWWVSLKRALLGKPRRRNHGRSHGKPRGHSHKY